LDLGEEMVREMLMGNETFYIAYAVASGIFLGVRCFWSRKKSLRLMCYGFGSLSLVLGMLALDKLAELAESVLPYKTSLIQHIPGGILVFGGLLGSLVAVLIFGFYFALVLTYLICVGCSWLSSDESLQAIRFSNRF
jgi:hypothetical protein